jgi:hypothetical protein
VKLHSSRGSLRVIDRQKSANDRYAGLSPKFGLPDRRYCIALTLILTERQGAVVQKISPSGLKGPSEHYKMLDTARRSDTPVDGPSLRVSPPLCPRACACTANRVAYRVGSSFPQLSGEYDLDTTGLHLCWSFVASPCIAENGLQGRVLERLRCFEPSLASSNCVGRYRVRARDAPPHHFLSLPKMRLLSHM